MRHPHALGSLYRYFIAANKMRIRFENALADPEVLNRFANYSEETKHLMWHVDDQGIFMYYWYGGLYVVVEGFRELKLKDDKIEAILQSPNTEGLRLMRNATFHYQKEFYSPKMMPFVKSADSVTWVRSLTEAFSEFFLREIPKDT
jgi:hypothetical protein